jgi:hypothetical protein
MRQYRSRLSEVETQKSIKSAVIFGGLTIVIIILAIFFGIQAFSHFTNLFSRPSTQINTEEESSLPAPNLQSPPQNTKDQTVLIKGSSQPNATIKITFNNSSDDTVADSDGNFQANISLQNGENTIYAQEVDDSGNTSPKSAIYTINYTNKVPNLSVNSPQNNQTFYGSDQKVVTVEGSTDANNSVTVNDRVAIVDSSGKFSLRYEIGDGDNTLKIISMDSAGNKKEIDIKVTYTP